MRIITAAIVLVVFLLTSCVSNGAGTASSMVDSDTSASTSAGSVKKVQTIKFQRMTMREISYPDGMLSGVVKNTYDEQGRILKEEQLNGNRVLVSQKIYSYKDTDKVEIQALNESGKLLGKSLQEYIGEKIIRETNFNPEGVLQTLEEYSYNDAGYQIKRLVRTANGNQTSSEYTWDLGNKVKTLVKDGSGSVIKSYKFAYNTDGKLLSEEEYSPSGALLSKTVHSYEKGQLVRTEIQNAQGIVQSATAYTNDELGNPVKQISYDRRGKEFEILSQSWQEFSKILTEK